MLWRPGKRYHGDITEVCSATMSRKQRLLGLLRAHQWPISDDLRLRANATGSRTRAGALRHATLLGCQSWRKCWPAPRSIARTPLQPEFASRVHVPSWAVSSASFRFRYRTPGLLREASEREQASTRAGRRKHAR